MHSGPLTRAAGLSPRVRGNRAAAVKRDSRAGSIPACAGEPSSALYWGGAGAVYPRVCGGTTPSLSTLAASGGLSPRVRGNPAPIGKYNPGQGSIPACAGEPPVAGGYGRPGWVYPRVCGGTHIPPAARADTGGLSPRVRGNRRRRADRRRRAGSIPACAGEPVPRQLHHPAGRVYPRVCGGTPAPGPGVSARLGLSPRVRGNLSSWSRATEAEGSIPACAGEPALQPVVLGGGEVYPRVCGGTPDVGKDFMLASGLSPRVRGNPRRR